MAILTGVLATSSAYAQTAAPAAPSASAVSEVVVTATRVVRDGYSAPTPTSVIGAAEIATKAPANIAAFVDELPSLTNSQTPQTNIDQASAGLSGINTLNLRALNNGANGGTRTLVLLDGQRVGASTLTGAIDINQFPEELVKRVDVVTGGASADWGSDAVGGVVNFVLDKTFTGVKGEIQGGATTYGDDASYKASLAVGAGFLNDRGHLLFAFEDAHNDGITGVPRSWANVNNEKLLFLNPSYTATNGQPQYVVKNDSGFATATPGGIITSGPLKGVYFGPGGTPAQFNYGPIVSGNFMQGGQSTDGFANSGDLDPRESRQNAFLRASFDVTSHVQVFGQASYAKASSYEKALDQFNFANLTINANNAFIPASTAAAITAYNAAHPTTPITSFTLGTFNQDLGAIPLTTDRSNSRFVIGASGDFNAFGSNWTWDAYSQETITDIYTAARLSITANYKAAINSVVNPTTGAIQCASIATNPNCVPYDIFGTGVNSSAALNYVLGTAWLKERLMQNVEAANLRGAPFSDWAGPISVAMGIEHREESAHGSNDPLSSTNAYFAGNYHATRGDYHVDEGYFEAVVPLAKGMAFAKNLDLNGAVRETDYSVSGAVTTWKVGLNYSPIDDITFRVTRSHDIRAPDLAELFQAGQTSTTVVVVPANSSLNPTSTAVSQSVFQVTSGTKALKPEAADSTGFGVVLKPRFLPGFQASVDYYDIHIADAITTLTAQQEVTECAEGVAALCKAVNLATGYAYVTPVNLAEQIARGIDFEASYRRNLETILPALKGNLTLRVLATHYLENYINNGVTAPTNNVGTNSANGNSLLTLPNWKYTASVAWEKGPLALSLTARGVSAGVYNTAYIQCAANCPAATATHPTISDNAIPGAYYLDTSITYKLQHGVEVYLSVDNLLDTAPVITAYGPSIAGAPISINPAIYDVLGRVFRLGARFKM